MSTKPQTTADFLERAAECERLAADSGRNAAGRETLLYLAMRWKTLADEKDAKQKAKLARSQPYILSAPITATGRRNSPPSGPAG
jgi:hypothetical protein